MHHAPNALLEPTCQFFVSGDAAICGASRDGDPFMNPDNQTSSPFDGKTAEDFLHQMRDGLLVTDAKDGRVLDTNEAMCRLLGYSREQMLALSLRDLTAEASGAAGASETGPGRHEGHYLRSDGTLVDLEVTTTEVAGAGLVHGIYRDISGRGRSETSFRDEAGRLGMLLARTPAVLYTCRPSGDFGATFISDNVEQLLGYRADSFTSDSEFWISHVHPDDLDRVLSALALLLTHGTHVHEYRFRHLDGTYRWMHDQVRLVRDDRGVPVEMSGSWIDISDQKEAELALRESENKHRKLVDGVPGIVYAYSTRRGGVFYSPFVKQVLGYSPEELYARPMLWQQSIHPDDIRRVGEVIQDTAAGQPFLVEYRIRDARGNWRWLADRSLGYNVDSSETIIEGLALDITERKALEDQLRQSQKLGAVGQLAGGVAHDFNNILGIMMMHLGFLREAEPRGAEARESIDELLAVVKRAASLTEQLLIFSRRSVLKVEMLDLGELVATLLKMLRRLIGDHIKVEFEAGEGIPAVFADRGMIEQVIMNLVVNARDAMPQGGTLVITLTTEPIDEARIQGLGEVSPGLFVCCSVADTGCGMDPVTLSRIFEPFFTTKECGKGTGLGLATVHGIAAQHKGWVDAESTPEKGSLFRLFLPASTGARTPPDPFGTPGPVGVLG